MKLKYKINDKVELEIEGEGQKEVFKELSAVQEIFGEEKCGLCKKNNLKFVVRNVDSNDYFEIRCNDCGGVLSFGQHKKGGTLFPKRKGENNEYLPNGGWHKWQPKND